MAATRTAVPADEQAFGENEELRGLIAAGTERGYLTFEEIASTLEEVEVTKEQVSSCMPPGRAGCGCDRGRRCHCL